MFHNLRRSLIGIKHCLEEAQGIAKSVKGERAGKRQIVREFPGMRWKLWSGFLQN